jgi:hypothetical protein
MPSINPNEITQKSLAQQNRQKCINILEKMTKRCYSMFRESTVADEILIKKFFLLKKKLDLLWDVYLDTEYHAETRKYIEKLSKILQWTVEIADMGSAQVSQLNRLQKLKNQASYKRQKLIGWCTDNI